MLLRTVYHHIQYLLVSCDVVVQKSDACQYIRLMVGNDEMSFHQQAMCVIVIIVVLTVVIMVIIIIISGLFYTSGSFGI